MPALTLSNLLLYSAQAALVIGALALTLVALRPPPAFRLAACRVVLLVLLLLPWQGLIRGGGPAPEPLAPLAIGAARAVDSADARAGGSVPWRTVIGGLLVTGVALRLLWLGAGLWRLRRLAGTLPDPDTSDEVAALQAELGTQARVHFAPSVAQPVTFGLRPATVLLPAALLATSAELRRAVLCHELLHVRRGDWGWVLAEEAMLALLWFHPAVWWLVGELQLAREQVVDRQTVAAIGGRRAYMDALFSAADAPSAPPLLAGFLRRRHLARRLVALAEEVAMSRARLAVGGMLMVGVLMGSGVVATAAWPLVQAPRDPAKPQVDTLLQDKIERLRGRLAVLSRADVEMPGGLSQDVTAATFVLDAVVEAGGAVSQVRLVSLTARNDLTKASLSASDLPTVDAMLGKITGGRMEVSAPPEAFGDAAALTQDLEAMLKAAAAALRQWRFEPPAAAPAIARVPVGFDVPGGRASFGPAMAVSGFSAVPSTMQIVPAREGGQPLRVGGSIAPPRKIVNVSPIYPDVAKEAKVQGIVVLGLTITPDGSVSEAWVERSIPLLDEAALDAVRQWRYQPTLLNGVPVPVQMTVTVNFTLDR